MAKNTKGMSLGKVSKATAKDDSDLEQDVEEIEDDDSTIEVTETDLSEEEESMDLKAKHLKDLVHFSNYEELKPAPTVGVISLVRDCGMSFVPKGVVKIPRVVAVVLADKKLGQIIS